MRLNSKVDRILLTNFGFTLVEVVIALGLASVGGLYLASIIVNQAKSQRGLTLTSDFQSLSSEIQTTLGNTSNCAVSFTDSTAPYAIDPANLLAVDIPAGQGIFYAKPVSGKPLELERARALLTVSAPDSSQVIARHGSGLEITQLKIQDWAGVPPIYSVNLYIQAQKYAANVPPAVPGARLMEKRIPFQILVDKAGKFIACGSDVSAMAALLPDSSLEVPEDGASAVGSSTSTGTSDTVTRHPSSDIDSMLNREISPEEAAQVRQMIQNTVKQLSGSQ